ncbi:MAG TPA: DUF3090 domain-containing protein [Actinomycetes bacterium]|nr:DUF3090 domain-containing protein [Actinomycetes bacterium]
MSREIYSYDPPERFIAGTVGEPGQRTFFIQAALGGRTTSVALEKEQVAVLAERMEELLDEVLRRTGGTAQVPAVAPVDLVDDGPLSQPIDEEFRVGALTLAWDGDTERVVIEAHARAETEEEQVEALDEEADDGPPMLRVRITGAMARAFAKRAQLVVSAGRPPCPFCGLPVDAEGHLCPRMNGHRPADPTA